MTLSPHQWHQRSQHQARWTKPLRNYVFEKIGIHSATRILEVGCGTGVILEELSQLSPLNIFGVDINLQSISLAREYAPRSILTLGNGLSLPFHSATFNIVLCHFLLLWVGNPLTVITEMVRVTLPGGFVLALAEPDYGGRIAYPQALENVSQWQTEALRVLGANPIIGRELRSHFSGLDLTNIEVGVLGGQWSELQTDEEVESEWEVINSDLDQNKEYILEADKLKAIDIYSLF